MNKRAPGKSAPVCLLVGEDQFSAQREARERINRFILPEEQTLGLETIDAQAEKIDEALACLHRCLEAIQTLGFLGGRKAVWLRADFLAHKDIGKNREVQEMAGTLAKTITRGLIPGHLLVITTQKLDERSSLYKACRQVGEIVEFKLGTKPKEKDHNALAFAAKAFADSGLQINRELLRDFVWKVGNDTWQLAQEVNKLAAYLGERRVVQADDIAAITSPARELFNWELGEALSQRDLRRALAVLRQLLFQREEPIGLIIGLEGYFRNLLLFREALDNRWLTVQQTGSGFVNIIMANLTETLSEQFQQALASEKGTPLHPFRAGKLAQQAQGFSRRELEQCCNWILAAHRQLVSIPVPKPLVLEYLVLKLCRSQRRSASG